MITVYCHICIIFYNYVYVKDDIFNMSYGKIYSLIHNMQQIDKETRLLNVAVLAKTHIVRTKTEFNSIATVHRHTQYLSIPSISSVKC